MGNTILDHIAADGFSCSCGKRHTGALQKLIIETGALEKLPQMIACCGAERVQLLTDRKAYKAAGERACRILEAANISYSLHIFRKEPLEPDEYAVGEAVMHFDPACDLILGVGSGVINDISKILAVLSGKTYIIVATAPSMDGYASATSSMVRGGLKISLNSCCPAVIIGDLDVLCAAPERMLQSGLGDMVAKYISICEWRIANLLLGEEFCPVIAQMVREAVQKCVSNAEALSRREPVAVAAVMEGLVITGIAMSYAQSSRPASGMEHYFSHIWDMRGLAFGSATDTHGIQCGIATLLSLRVYECIRSVTPDREKALAHVAGFDPEAWNAVLRQHLGDGTETMIALERREGKYDPQKHAARLDTILNQWESVLQIIDEELPPYAFVERALKAVGAPTAPEQIGLSGAEVKAAFLMGKDIRDKYVGTRLLWDLGELDGIAEQLFD